MSETTGLDFYRVQADKRWCRHCIREMEASAPLPECVTGSDGRCVTCDELHGVRITHWRRP